jgi:hypothetical protein
MRYLYLILFLLFATPVIGQEFVRPELEQKSDILIVKKDWGGPMSLYIARYMEMNKRGIKLAIDGECLSSCTLFFKFIPKQATCITSNAKLGFHRSNRPEGTTVMIMSYPIEIIMWLLSEGLTEDVKYLPEEFLQSMFAKCPPLYGEKVE